VLTATGERLEGASLLMQDGKIVAIGNDLELPDGTTVVDASGLWITPGIIDVHSHLGVYASPAVTGHSDGNESTAPVTAEVWAEHSVWPHDPGFSRALAGGVTTLQILPGSANLIGGRSVTLKNVPARTMQGMKFPGAPYGLKMACGENPKRFYGGKGRSPSTRMGNMAGYRKAWIDAQEYRRKWQEYERSQAEKAQGAKGKKKGRGSAPGPSFGQGPPKRDLGLETLVGVLDGEILVHNHCYRGDEMAMMLDLAKEFGYKVTAFHHAVEAFKVADLLAEQDVCAAMWADWWGFKMEAFDSVRENIAMVERAGACAIVHSDSGEGIQRLNQEAAKAMAAANRAGIPVRREQAIRWLTLNPAKALGIDEQTGSLEVGKAADVVVWSGDPFSVYQKATQVYIDGALIYDRQRPDRQPVSDFELEILGSSMPSEVR
jgi:imidazolonepropionase-like amidohydrolase